MVSRWESLELRKSFYSVSWSVDHDCSLNISCLECNASLVSAFLACSLALSQLKQQHASHHALGCATWIKLRIVGSQGINGFDINYLSSSLHIQNYAKQLYKV